MLRRSKFATSSVTSIASQTEVVEKKNIICLGFQHSSLLCAEDLNYLCLLTCRNNILAFVKFHKEVLSKSEFSIRPD
jgi:hypothetical protein